VQATPNPARGRYNGKIVFISDRDYKGLSVWTMNHDGSSPTRLTDDTSRTERLPSFSPVYDSNPVWSPDGTKIAFISNRDYLFALYVMNADGSNARLVTDKVIDAGEPAWSPDGGKLAFSGGVRGSIGLTIPSVNIYVVNVDGSGLTQLTRDAGMNASPAWSPDGKQIAFSSSRDSLPQSKIWLMNADGSNQRILPNPQDNGFVGGQPVWSPEGTKILFTGYRICRGSSTSGIYMVNADGSNSRLVTNDPKTCGRYASPKWSPDGTRILAGFAPERDGILEPIPEIIIMNVDGSNQINISNRGRYTKISQSTFTDVHADWQPLLAPPDFKSSVIGFSAPSYTMYETGDVPITVTRTGNLNDVASCFYVALTSNPELKYVGGALRFAPGESSKTIPLRVPVSGTSLTWSYRIVLSDNEGNATFVGGIKEAAVTILPGGAASHKKTPN
jgi:Tol biopolymer transport system component